MIGPRVVINVDNWNAEGRNGAVDLNAMSAVLLHEMGHVYNALKPYGSGGPRLSITITSTAASQDNEQLIYRTCFQ